MTPATFCGREEELKHLQDAWRVVMNEGRLQLVTFIAESGLGKTRLVQEFYGWLAREYRAGNDGGYWPLQLSQHEQNLVVNPDVSGVDADYVMLFLWWAVRLIDPAGRNQELSNAVSTHLKALIPHLQPMYKARRAKKYWQDGGKTIASATLQYIPIAGTIIGWSEAAFELYQVGQKARQDKLLRPEEAEQREGKDLNERILIDLSQLFGKAGDEATIPMVWVVDDAHFSTADPNVVELFVQLIQTAHDQHWPLLVIVTHWEKEWHEQVNDESRPSLANSIMRGYQTLDPSWQPYRLKAIPDDELAPVLSASLPGLTAEQSQRILARADGNPRFLEEVILLCRARPRYFVDRNLHNALTDQGCKSILEHSTNLHQLVEARLLEAPKEVRDILVLSSLQGVRLLYLVSRKLVERLIVDGHELEGSETKQALEQAQTPHGFINLLSDNLAEFSQRVFYEVARQGLEDIVDTEKALDGGFGTTPKKVYSRLELSILRNLRFREDLLRTPSLSKKWGFIFLGNLSQSRTLFLN